MFLFLWALISAAAAQMQNNMMLPLLLMDQDSKSDTGNMALMLMMAQNGQHGGPGASDQMNMMLPLILMSKSDSKGKSSNSDLMLLMLMQQPNAINSPSALLPYILLKDKDTGSTNTDMTTMFIATSMMQRSCDVDTNQGIQGILPLMLLEQDKNDDKLMTLLMMQMMSPQNNVVSLDMMLPYILLMNDDKNDMSNLLTMAVLSSSMGGMQTANGYNSNFNMLLPFAMMDCKSDDTECSEKRQKMMVMLMAMQSSAPGSPMNSQQILPLLLMKDDTNNEELILFMTMLSQQPNCFPEQRRVIITKPLPEPVVETMLREFKIDATTGKKTLIRTSRLPYNTGE